MKSSKMRLFSPFAMLMLVGALLFGATGSAFAADTWTPNFDGAHHHVYVDPKLVGTVVDADKVSALENSLETLSAKDGIQYFFVYTTKGDESLAPGQPFTDMEMTKLLNGWQAKSGFPLETYQIILLARNAQGKHQFALNGGNLIQKEGITPTLKDIGQSAFSTYLPNDPTGFAVSVAGSINGEVAHYHFMHVTLWYIILGGLILAVLLTLTFLFFSKNSKMKVVLEQWRGYATHCGELADKLEGAHMGFLKSQQTFSAAFTGATKTRFDQARGHFANLNSRQLAIQDLFDRAERAAKGVIWPMFWQADAVAAMLSTEAGSWTGNELPDAKKTLKDFFEKITWNQPLELITGFDALYTETDNELKEIHDAFTVTTQNAAAIKAMLGEIDSTRPALEKEAELPFAPYQSRYDDLSQRGGKVLDLMASNPIGAKAESEAVEQGIEQLKADMLRAVAIKKSYGQTQSAITAATNRAAQVRQQAVEYAYPFVANEEHPATAGTTYLLTEEYGNPDGAIKDANTHFTASQTALVAAKLDEADSEKAAAEKSAAGANSVIDAVMTAKSYVEKHVTPVRTNLSNLRNETPAAETAMAELVASFIAGNFTGAKDNVATAKSVANATEAQLGQARSTYHAQHFLAAQTTVQSTGASIDSARQGLAAVHSRLAELKRLRDHAKTTAAQVDQLNRTLTIKLQQNSTYTSNATDNSLHNQATAVSTLVSETAKPVCDWVAMASSADTTLAALQKVDGAIDADKAAHDLASQRVSELSGSIRTARAVVDNNDTRQPARDKLNNAINALSRASGTLQAPKSDWNSIVRSVDSVKADVDEAVRLARNDQEQANEARTALAQAQEKVGLVVRTDYSQEQAIGGQLRGFNANADCTTAESSLVAAQQSMYNRDYENAKAYANQAYNQAEQARQAAINAVATAVAAAVSAYETAQRLEAERLAAEEARNNPPAQNNNTVSGPDFQDTGRTVSQPDFQDNNRTVTGGDDNF